MVGPRRESHRSRSGGGFRRISAAFAPRQDASLAVRFSFIAFDASDAIRRMNEQKTGSVTELSPDAQRRTHTTPEPEGANRFDFAYSLFTEMNERLLGLAICGLLATGRRVAFVPLSAVARLAQGWGGLNEPASSAASFLLGGPPFLPGRSRLERHIVVLGLR